MDLGTEAAWTVRAVGGLDAVPDALLERLRDDGVPATVPGCVHTDLLAQGLIPDPYLDLNEAAVQWIGHVDWEYRGVVDLDEPAPDVHSDLVCDGLDTVATVHVNGALVARTQNMHRGYRFDVAEHLHAGSNTVAVRFDSAVTYTERACEEHGYLPQGYEHPYSFIRKMACNFGWDWGPTLVTAGIWRGIRLHRWRRARLEELQVRTDVDGATGLVHVRAGVVGRAGFLDGLTVWVEVAGRRHRVEPAAGAIDCTIPVDDARLWWPAGYGAQHLEDVTVTLADEDGVVERHHRRVGFRTVELDTGPDAFGRAFTVKVNGRPIFVKGANWIPDDCFVSGITREQYAERIAQARAANLNLLRVWGGGLYEDDAFYELCDEQGLLVWQDFLFACAGYPETEPFRTEIAAEARQAVRRLGSHPSVALWNGSNENLLGWYDWGWPEQVDDRGWGEWYYTRLLPAIVTELAPTTPYIPSSPFSSTPDVHPNHPGDGPVHLWDVWNALDHTRYRDDIPRFVAEYGFQAPPTWPTLTDAVHDEPLTPRSPGMLAHQKQIGGPDKLDRNLRGHVPEPTTMAAWHLATSLNQAHALRLAIEHFRSWWPRCAGSIVWQLNDCWPVTSWSLIDGAGRVKPAWHAVRAAYADRLLTIQPREAGLSLVLVNDTDLPWRQDVRVRLVTLDGDVRRESVVPVQADARATRTVTLEPDLVAPNRRRQEVLVADAGDLRSVWRFVPDDAVLLPAPRYRPTVTAAADAIEVTVTAETFLSDLVLLAEQADPRAVVDTGLVSLLPGESHTFRVSGFAGAAPDRFAAVLHTSNELFHAAS
ncbi:glycoside hydrolase family 2 protein [Jiangella aurantiaca]|uniref:beta-mannosidase n=1 Tax=Jiangella aurantiaca TaxID=2530373 RepID=A0A4V2YSX6_9ACTN|nr:glycoside hydrolase family 2 protein [Jiangella aurantiaca]TDD71647.1 glycoside hydrolase family 2 protein [Jiangella aurantiaca]